MVVVDEGGAGRAGIGAQAGAPKEPLERPHERVRRRRCDFDSRAADWGWSARAGMCVCDALCALGGSRVPPDGAGSVGGWSTVILGPMVAFCDVFVLASGRPLARVAPPAEGAPCETSCTSYTQTVS